MEFIRIWHMPTTITNNRLLYQILKNTYMKGINQISALHPASESIMGYNLEDGVDSQLYTR